MQENNSTLTDHEAALLALVARAGPLTGHQITRVYQDSPVSTFSSSKGKIYPIIRRLRERAFISATPISGDGRGTEQLNATDDGKRALKMWVKETKRTHLLPEDPFRTKIQSFDLLSRDEQIEWITEVKAQLHEKLATLEEYKREVAVPYHYLVHENALRSVRSRMDWLDLVLLEIVRNSSTAKIQHSSTSPPQSE